MRFKSVETATESTKTLSPGGVLGRIVPPFVADRIGCFNVVIPVTFAAAGCVLAMLVREPGTGGVVAIALLYGAVNAACGWRTLKDAAAY